MTTTRWAALAVSAALLTGCSAAPAAQTDDSPKGPPVSNAAPQPAAPETYGQGTFTATSKGTVFRVHVPGQLSPEAKQAVQLSGAPVQGTVTLDVDNTNGPDNLSVWSIGVIDGKGSLVVFEDLKRVTVLGMKTYDENSSKVYDYANSGGGSTVPAGAKATLEYGAKSLVPAQIRRVYFTAGGFNVDAKPVDK